MDARTILRDLDIRPRKALGQNFLVDRTVVPRTVSAAEIGPQDVAIEVGPGLGVLTEELARVAGHVIAVELDERLAAALRRRLANYANVTIIRGNILELSVETLLEETLGRAPSRANFSYKVVANLPYYVTSPVLRFFLEAHLKPRLMVIMVQKEVAERIAAAPPKMSLLAISVQFYGQPRIVGIVPPKAFYPVPKVESAILRIDLYEHPAVNVANREAFFKLVHAGFEQRRKQLPNTMASVLRVDKEQVIRALEQAGLDPRRRAETLSLEDWERLYQAMEAQAS